jgi:hypothetical protein
VPLNIFYLFIRGLFDDAANSSNYITSNNEYRTGSMWQEAVMASFKVISRNLMEGLKKITKTSVRIDGLRAEI